MPGRRATPGERAARARTWFLNRARNALVPSHRIAAAADYLRAACSDLPEDAALIVAEEAADYLIDLADRARTETAEEAVA